MDPKSKPAPESQPGVPVVNAPSVRPKPAAAASAEPAKGPVVEKKPTLPAKDPATASAQAAGSDPKGQPAAPSSTPEKKPETPAKRALAPEDVQRIETLRKERLRIEQERQRIEAERKQWEAERAQHEKVLEALKQKKYVEALHAAGASIEDVNMQAMQGADPLVLKMQKEIEDLRSGQQKWLEEQQKRQREQAELEWSRTVAALKADTARAIQAEAERYDLLAADGEKGLQQLVDDYIEIGRRTGGQLPPLDEFLEEAENALLEESLRRASRPKVQAKLREMLQQQSEGEPAPAGQPSPKPPDTKGQPRGARNGRMTDAEFVEAFQRRAYKP